jgi:hypothetical protein
MINNNNNPYIANLNHTEHLEENIENTGSYLIKNSLEYYDNCQPFIQKLINKINYIKIITRNDINDEFIFYDDDNKQIFRSKIETISIFIPHSKTWKWAWSNPFSKYKNTLISREILNYALTLNSENDLFLKLILLNSKIIIKNDYQLDIYLAIFAFLSKKPFIMRIYLTSLNDNISSDNTNDDIEKNSDDHDNNLNDNDHYTEYIYEYKKILQNPKSYNSISLFIIIVDWSL